VDDWGQGAEAAERTSERVGEAGEELETEAARLAYSLASRAHHCDWYCQVGSSDRRNPQCVRSASSSTCQAVNNDERGLKTWWMGDNPQDSCRQNVSIRGW
jgi:hypothetical protein